MFSVSIGSKTEYNKITDNVKNAIDYSTTDRLIVYVYFNDKGPDVNKYLSNPLSLVSQKSLDRRRKVLPEDKLVDFTDVPLYPEYVNQVSAKVNSVRHELKWLNCVSVEGTKAQVISLSSLDCVTKIELVERYKVAYDVNESIKGENITVPSNSVYVDSMSYGASLNQDTIIKVNKVHNQGIYGQGIVIGHFDAGYLSYTHEAFTTYPMKIWKKKDFHTGDTVTLASHSHGQATLSLIGGYKPGSLISPAFASTFILCRTEVDPTETPIEMDHWAAAAQWVDSLGADVISSSLGYLTFDAPYSSYTYIDMNGHTMPITIAAALAAHKGIVVSNSAGNSGSGTVNTLGGPADADSICTIGALDPNGTRASYSSVGPTTDSPARIKPDLMTQGSYNQVATQTGYSTSGSGTSWACPMAAGVIACMLSANKNLTPLQVRGILRKFASNNASPNNTIGWGTIDAQKSVDSARTLDVTPPTIIFTPPFTTTTNTGVVWMTARIKDNGIIRYRRTNEAPRLYFRKLVSGVWSSYTPVNASTVTGDTLFQFSITASAVATTVEYYFAAQDIALPNSLLSTLPTGGSGINPPGTTAPGTRYSYVVNPVSYIQENAEIPSEFKLFNNYPNPFNPETIIKFAIAKVSNVTLKVYDIAGKEVSILVNNAMNPGYYSVRFDASSLSSGVYFYKIQAGDFTEVKRMLFVK